MPKESVPRSLPTPIALHILMVLAAGPRHGYGIKQAIERRTDGALHVGPGTLYEAIRRLLRTGWIAPVAKPADEAQPADRPPRKYYDLTAAGREGMQKELSRLEAVLRLARDDRLVLDSRGS